MIISFWGWMAYFQVRTAVSFRMFPHVSNKNLASSKLVGGFNLTQLKNMLVKMGSSSPIFGVKMKKNLRVATTQKRKGSSSKHVFFFRKAILPLLGSLRSFCRKKTDNLLSKKSPTGPTERTPNPEYLIALAIDLGVRW